MLPYLLHVATLLALCYLSYILLLKKETFYQLNRSVLLLGMVIIFVLPLLHIPADWSIREKVDLKEIAELQTVFITTETPVELTENSPTPSPTVQQQTPIAIKPKGVHLETAKKEDVRNEAVISSERSIEKKILSEENKFSLFTNVNWLKVLFYGYLLGVLIFGLNFLIQFIGLLLIRWRNPKIKDENFTIVELSDDRPPFSFFNHIFINPSQYEWDTYEQILAHEKIHAAQRHSFDILLAELIKVTQWFNPFAWWYRRAVEDNLEYLTDSVMLHRGTQRESYQMNLLKVAVPHHPLTLGTNYNQSTLKQRIKMMNIKKSSLASSWKYLFLIPLLALSVLILNNVTAKAEAQNLTNTETKLTTDPANKLHKEKSKEKEKEKNKEKTNKKTPKKLELGNIENINLKDKSADIVTRDGRKLCLQHNGNGLIYNTRDTFKIINTDSENGVIIINQDGFKMRVNSDSEHNFITINEKDGFQMKFDDDGKSGFINIDEKGFKLKVDDQNFINIDENGFQMNFTSDDDDNNSFNFHSNHPDHDGNHWHTSSRNSNICISISHRSERGYWTNNSCISRSEFPNIPEGEDITFELNREAGTIVFSGDVNNGEGEGDFEFTPNESFRSYLKDQGFSPIKDMDMFHFILVDMNKSYLSYLKGMGYKSLTTKDLLSIAHHGIRQKDMKDGYDAYAKYGLTDLSFKEIIQFHIHDVTPEYIQGLRNNGFTDLDAKEIVQFAIHDVDADYIKELRDAGFIGLDAKEIVQFAIHDVDARYVKSIHDYGFKDISNRDIVQFAIHDVDTDFIKELRDMGYDDLSTKEIVQFAIHDVDARYVKEIRDNGFGDMDAKEIVQFAIHDVDTDFIKEVRSMGYNDLDDRDIVQFAIHDVDARYIREIREAGFTKISPRDIVQFSIHDVDTDYLVELRDLGFGDLDERDVIQFAIHDVDAKFVAEMKRKGYDNIDARDLVQLSIHGVDSDYIEELAAVGFKNVSVRDLIQMKIHDVDDRFIKKMQDKGYNDLSPRELINKKIHGYGSRN